MLSENLQNFLWNTKQPWFRLAYKLYWAQLADIIELKNLKILDFGSGFGATANYLAKNNEVTAIEPNSDMMDDRECENNYTQITGKIEKLKDFGDGFFDVVVCHNVLEFAEERAEIVRKFSRILKSGGILSVIKHNKCGRIMQKVIYENNSDEAIILLDGGDSSNTFGSINYYASEDLVKWGDNFKIEKILAVRTFFALQQNNDIKYEPDWIDKMFKVEMKVCDLEPYKSISSFNHVLMKKI
jgi:SAM-dependent methyltransferase